MDAATEKIAHQVAERMAHFRREDALKSRHKILIEAFRLLRELGEDELADRLLATGKRIGGKLNQQTGD